VSNDLGSISEDVKSAINAEIEDAVKEVDATEE